MERRLVRLNAFEELLECRVVEFDRSFHELLTIFFSLIQHVCRDVGDVELRTERLVVPDDRLHLHEVDHALERAFRADRQLDRNRLRAETLHDVVETLEEVGAGLVHLVREHDARDFILVALAPDGFGLRFDALVAVKHDDSAVEHAQRTLDFDGEVHVARGVDNVETLVGPECGGRGGRNRDAALLLLLHPVHRRSAVMDFADFVRLAGIIKNPLGRRRLAGVDMRHDAEVAVVFDFMIAGHL